MAETAPSDHISQEDIQQKIDEVEYTGRRSGPVLAVILSVIAAVWSMFQLWIASPLPFEFGIGIVDGVPARGIHLAFGLVLTFLMFPAARSLAHRRISALDITLALLGGFAALWVLIAQDGITARLGSLLVIDLFGFRFPIEALLGCTGILLLLEATRRAIGIPLVIVASLFLLYSFFGQNMPDIVSHKGMSVDRLIGYQWMGQEAIFGIPIDVSVSFVFLFVLFGSLLDRAGAGKYFLDLAFAMVGKYRGGPAKAAILASGMTGLISGSSIANVVTTGVFTIPVMRQTGLSAVKAGAIEVAASTNGQIMPPIMGAAAFIIAELIGISYFDVVVAAFIPAIISYIGLLYISHLEALKLDLKGLPSDKIQHFNAVFFTGVHFIVPIVLLVFLLMVERWTAGSAVFYTIMAMFLIMIATKSSPKGMTRLTMAALYMVPIVAFLLVRFATDTKPQPSIQIALGVGALVVVALTIVRQMQDGGGIGGIREAFVDIYRGLVAGARNMVGIAIAVATAGIIVGAVSSTGLNNAMVAVVETISGGNIYGLLVLTAVLSLVLGMGLPTTANYLVVASLLAGVMVELGSAAGLVMPLIAVHLFVFYFGLMADSTPPVCLAAFAAAAISRADPLRTGVQSFLYDIRTAILPFVFIFNHELLLIGVTSIWHGIMVFVVSLIAVLCFASATQGWLMIRTSIVERLLLLVVMMGLFRPDFFLNQIYPDFASVNVGAFVSDELQVKKGLKVRVHTTRETEYGDRFRLFVLTAPGGPAGQKSFGIKLARDGGRYNVGDLAITGPAAKAKMDFGDIVTAIDVEQTGRPPKELVYPIVLSILAGIFWLQVRRRRREL